MRSAEEFKASIRKKMIRMREKLSEETLKRYSREITRKLVELEAFQSCQNILIFLSLPGEVQTEEMIERALSFGKRVYVPLVDAERKCLKISELPGLDIEFEVKRFGVREPGSVHLNIQSPAVLDFVLVPGLAFDRKGGRIGFGAGYYDRFLKEVADRVVRVGVAFDFQILESVPQTELDVPVQKILTENETIVC
ncbi:MAG: 5-formyltetrahydrofolate cyclo-ligase [Nitrospinae bacterium]|nr:5-formyltetrahydrofolate cyclo-ligase [Nitrospinota bacterium]MDA1109658.1 5-formyltetrahydrofolate cyclo-ligase [Nitrospinota bacterium]